MDGALTGRTLGGGAYRVGRLLGQGAMGAVYEGVQEALGRAVAIKVLHASKGQLRQDQFERFQREAKAAAALGHANIVQITDFQWVAGEPPFLVMERLVGQSLGEAIKRNGKLPSQRVAFISAQVLAALHQAHTAGIVHRDIKPDNVFLTLLAMVNDIVKVLDFGVAKLLDEAPLTLAGAMIGSPAYMPPEQAFGRPVDARSDVYAVGATMYHALSGRPPLDARDAAEFLTKVELPVPPLVELVPGFDRSLSEVVAKAMAKRPEERFPSADAMRLALMPWAKPRSPSMAELQAQVPVRSNTGSFSATRASAPPPGGPAFSQGSVAPPAQPGFMQGSVAPPAQPGFMQGSVAPPAAPAAFAQSSQASGGYPAAPPPALQAPLVPMQGASVGTQASGSRAPLLIAALAAGVVLSGVTVALVFLKRPPPAPPGQAVTTSTTVTSTSSSELPEAPSTSAAPSAARAPTARPKGATPPAPSTAPSASASVAPVRNLNAPAHFLQCRATGDYPPVLTHPNQMLANRTPIFRACGDMAVSCGQGTPKFSLSYSVVVGNPPRVTGDNTCFADACFRREITNTPFLPDPKTFTVLCDFDR